MSVAADVFTGLKAAAEDGLQTERRKIIGRDQAAGYALGAITDAERSAGNFFGDEGVEQIAVALQIEKVGIRQRDIAGDAAPGSGQYHKPFLMSDLGVGTQQCALDPAEDSGSGPDAEGETQNGEQ